MLDFLRQEGIDESLIARIEQFRSAFPAAESDTARIPVPKFRYYGREIWELAITAILSGENILLVGPKATGKNVLAENLSAVFRRPEWDISFYLNTDAASLIGTDTFKNGEASESMELYSHSNKSKRFLSVIYSYQRLSPPCAGKKP